MPTAEERPASLPSSSEGSVRALGRIPAWGALGVLLLLALALRLWGIGQGLPYAYNTDENAHFLARAIGMFGHSLNPEYCANPPALTYLLHMLLAVFYGSGAAVGHAYATHPTEVWILARAAVAVLGTLAIWLLYSVGSRLFGRAVGLTAGAIQAVAFLPVFYAHLALNDVPTLAPATLCLLGAAGVLRKGRMVDYLLGGIGLGLGCATKYTAGIMLLPLLAAVICRFLESPAAAQRRVVIGTLVAGASALAAFFAANPYAILDYSKFHAELVHQSTLSAESQGKLGAPKESGILYYLWSFSWGLGWVPALAA
ncbi:MAG: ArnT family glycosyltransferase, partial [Solirubrobacteraceae bacterium]